MTALQILSVAAELFPFAKTGGLADVTGALPPALARHGIGVRSLIPGYPEVLAKLGAAEPIYGFENLFGGPARLLASRIGGGRDLLVLDAHHLYGRPGNPYIGPDGKDWPDNAQRFAALAWVAAQIGLGMLDWLPDLVHAHDWHAGLAPAYLALADRRRPATVMTVHNLAFQGQFPAALLDALKLPRSDFAPEGVEYHGAIGFLKAGLVFADRITTVSPTYAREIQTPAGGMGLDGLLRSRAAALTGIVNGIDEETWNPETDPHLAARYTVAELGGRAANKVVIQQRFGLDQDLAAPVFCVVSRLTFQKGMDVLLASVPRLMDLGAQLAVLGLGDAALEHEFVQLARAHPGRIGCILAHDEALSHQLQGGADVILVPSRFEPCGLTQLYGLRYGAIPVVARVGGLADTIVDANDAALSDGVATGIQFGPVTLDALDDALSRAVELFRNRTQWSGLQYRGMTRALGWDRSATRYIALYGELIADRR